MKDEQCGGNFVVEEKFSRYATSAQWSQQQKKPLKYTSKIYSSLPSDTLPLAITDQSMSAKKGWARMSSAVSRSRGLTTKSLTMRSFAWSDRETVSGKGISPVVPTPCKQIRCIGSPHIHSSSSAPTDHQSAASVIELGRIPDISTSDLCYKTIFLLV